MPFFRPSVPPIRVLLSLIKSIDETPLCMRFSFEMPKKQKLPNQRANVKKTQLFPIISLEKGCTLFTPCNYLVLPKKRLVRNTKIS